MNNEPVAWTDGKGNYFDKNSFFPVDDLIPLYTHPAKTLTGAVGPLSDEEILKEAEGYGMGEKFIQDAPLFHAIKFAKAILKRASEK